MEAILARLKWELGKVIWFDEYSGKGEIRGEDGKDFFVHYSAIESNRKWKQLKAEKQVKYVLNQDPKRPQIKKVKEL